MKVKLNCDGGYFGMDCVNYDTEFDVLELLEGTDELVSGYEIKHKDLVDAGMLPWKEEEESVFFLPEEVTIVEV